MTIIDMLESCTIETEGRHMMIAVIIILSLIQIAPIQINPWSKLFGWIGEKMGHAITASIEEHLNKVEKHLERVEEKLDKHIKESEVEKLQKTRATILDFANSCMNHKKHTQEQFKFIIAECDAYEEYIAKTGIKNGVADASIAEIHRIYEKCLRENSFIKEE